MYARGVEKEKAVEIGADSYGASARFFGTLAGTAIGGGACVIAFIGAPVLLPAIAGIVAGGTVGGALGFGAGAIIGAKNGRSAAEELLSLGKNEEEIMQAAAEKGVKDGIDIGIKIGKAVGKKVVEVTLQNPEGLQVLRDKWDNFGRGNPPVEIHHGSTKLTGEVESVGGEHLDTVVHQLLR